jgi:hypothetical protein
LTGSSFRQYSRVWGFGFSVNPPMRACLAFLLLLTTVWAPGAAARDRLISGTADNQVATAVLKSLLSTDLGKTMPKLHYRVLLLARAQANAYSNGTGTVAITAGLLPVFQGDRGVWAAVIGHELGHVLLAHPDRLQRFRLALRKEYAHSAGAGLAGQYLTRSSPGQGVFRLKGAHGVEYQADFIGMMLMAEAGYQPGFSLILEQRLLYGLGSQPELLAMLSHHPRMERRETRTRKSMEAALAIFRSRWPDAAKSPGGNLPPYGEIGAWTVREADGGSTVVFHVPVAFHRAAGVAVWVAAFFLDHDQRVRAATALNRASDGSLVMNVFLKDGANGSGAVTLETPARALATHHNRLTAVVALMAGGRMIAVASRGITVNGDDAR